MKFACITLSFNQDQFLQEAITSIREQFSSMDYVIYDPGSKDDSRSIALSNRDSSTRVLFVDGDAGPSDGLNRALDVVDGDIFYYLNADDRVLPGAFAFAEKYFLENPKCDVLHGSIEIINKGGHVLRTLPVMKFSLRGRALNYAFVYQQATFIRMKALKTIRFNTSNRISWDAELIVDLALQGAEIHSTKMVLGQFRIYNESITGSPDYQNLVERQNIILSRRILGRSLTRYETFMGINIRYVKAIARRIWPRIKYLP